MVPCLEARITLVATPLSRDSACSILTRSSRCPSTVRIAPGSSSSARSRVSVLALTDLERELTCSSAVRISLRLPSSWVMKVFSWVSSDLTVPVRPSSAWLSSSLMIFS